MKLYHRELGHGKPLIILHGLFGSSDNWMSIARELESDYKIYLVDQRNHGQSANNEEFSYTAMADDLNEFINEHGIEKPYILGHSMGGKTAMKFAITHADMWKKLIVVDIAPKAYPVRHDTILEGLKSIDVTNLKSRGDADRQLANYVSDLGTRQFLLKNLSRKSDGGFEWKINLPVIDKNIEAMGEGIEDRLAIEREVLFIRGEKSDYIQDKDNILIVQLFPNSEVKTVKNAGHWVHAEQPEVLIGMVREFLGSPKH
ncbi:Putative esterase/lipase ybfF [Fulvivirga imtechensis AK7]|uniref:Putative esterase/lipase ybfF n=1 Tax=Fulvivirga imtechensis AK7 TaxID=1237149 RepID=L8JTV8_9BACT|nr:alpha/beta fold hydrolase [Fulvivirga imtechensis]ELR70727.1 Putative esterase/lipase ybfF [Fulvivirga imtechensis AK7]